MTIHTHNDAPTRFVDAGGIRHAYRRFGADTGFRWSSSSISAAA